MNETDKVIFREEGDSVKAVKGEITHHGETYLTLENEEYIYTIPNENIIFMRVKK